MDPSNPYQSPAAAIRATGKPQPQDVPEDIRKDIRNGAIFALIVCGLTLALVLYTLYFTEDDPYAAWNLIDVGLIAALAFGIWRKSRIAATVMFVYYVGSKIIDVVDTRNPSGILISIAFAYYLYKAMLATYRYHRFVKQWRHAPELPSTAVMQPPALPDEPSAPA